MLFRSANCAHAASIQLTNKGITAVDGLLANGLSHGRAMHATRTTLRTKMLWAVDEFMGVIFYHSGVAKTKAPVGALLVA